MELITLLIESTLQLLTCQMNPEDREEALTVERSSGAMRDNEGSSFSKKLSDSPVKSRGRGDTRITLKLLFDTELLAKAKKPAAIPTAASATGPNVATPAIKKEPEPEMDVRDLTLPLWKLTEYTANTSAKQSARVPGPGAPASSVRATGSRELPRVRVFWGTAWEIPAVVESVAERYERFSDTGRPQRSWMTLRLLRISDEVLAAELSSRYGVETMPTGEEFKTLKAEAGDEREWGLHEVIGGGTTGDQLWQLAQRYYGDPTLWRLIAIANNIENPLKMAAGTMVKIPPKSMLARLRQLRESRA